MLDITDRSRALAVRGHLVLASVRARLDGSGERGAQAAEYAMLGGVSAAACTVVIKVVNNNQDIFSQLLSTVFGALGRVVRAWF